MRESGELEASRAHAEHAKEAVEKRLEQVFDFLPDPTFAIDKLGQVIVWNKAMATLTGIDAKEMLGKGYYAYALPFYGERKPILIDLALDPSLLIEDSRSSIEKMGDTLISKSNNLILKQGTRLDLWSIAAPFRDADWNVIGAVESVRDVSLQVKAEEELAAFASELERRVEERTRELENAEDSLVEAEKYAVVGRLGSSLAHELNTPLGAIISSVSLCNRELSIKLEELGATEVHQRALILAENFSQEMAQSILPWAASPKGFEILKLAQRLINFHRSLSLINKAASYAQAGLAMSKPGNRTARPFGSRCSTMAY
ncbi:hypothetical protein MASR2M78_05830 [Treponema sp.]